MTGWLHAECMEYPWVRAGEITLEVNLKQRQHRNISLEI